MVVNTREDVGEAFVSYAEQLRREGREEGAREALLRGLTLVLRARFGMFSPEIEARLAEASVAELERWLVRASTVSSGSELWA
jgi:hypothetical protein